MGMVCVFRRASDHELDLLLREPSWITAYLHGDEFDEFDELAEPATARGPGFLARLFRRPAAPAPPAPPPVQRPAPPVWDERAEDDEVGVDKAWHGLHFLFTGAADEGTEPATYILSGGEEIGDVDVGCSVARAIHSPGVQRFADFLSAFSREDLLHRYEPRRMLELDIYPRLWKEERQEQAFEYLWGYFQILRDFVAEAARRRSGMIVYVT
jgi:hypothetical protein